MSNIEHTVPTFERAGMPLAYDLLVRAIYLPVGGEQALRRAAIERLELTPAARVLELGCGTGSFTRLLVAAGAAVTSVDGSLGMLARARSKAGAATFEHADLRTFQAPANRVFDVVFFGFVLHELAESSRAQLLRQAVRCLAPRGRLVIVDHAVPTRSGFARGWRRFLTALEPPSVRGVLAAGYDAEVRAAGLTTLDSVELARGVAKLLVARKDAA